MFLMSCNFTWGWYWYFSQTNLIQGQILSTNWNIGYFPSYLMRVNYGWARCVRYSARISWAVFHGVFITIPASIIVEEWRKGSLGYLLESQVVVTVTDFLDNVWTIICNCHQHCYSIRKLIPSFFLKRNYLICATVTFQMVLWCILQMYSNI